MGRSHPPTLLKIVERTLSEECGVSPGQRLLIAISGGPDSNALAHVLSKLRKRAGFELVAHGVDHGLRQNSAAELDLAAAWCQELGVPFTRTEVSLRPGGNLQARARAARYEALWAAAGRLNADFVATAHHADDRAETVILRLLRGAGPRGLAVLPARTGSLLRPLIRARKADISAHIQRHSVPFALDPSNQNPRFLRVRVRREVMPLLEELSPSIVRHLNALADQLENLPSFELLDEKGEVLELSRAQREQLQRALRLGQRRARIRLHGGREVVIDPATRHLRVVSSVQPENDDGFAGPSSAGPEK